MKNLIVLSILALIFGTSTVTQDGPKEAVAIQQFLNLDKNKTQALTQLLDEKYKIKNDPKSTENVKKKLPWMIEKKIEGVLTPDEMKKLKANKELFELAVN